MNILLEQLPETVEIGDREYRLDTDFRTCLRIILAFEDPELTSAEKQIILVKLLYGVDAPAPADRREAVRLGLLFLDCGEPRRDDSSPADTERVFSFQHDARYIYTAVRQTHGVDLDRVDHLHWWKFCYMFSDLSEDCYFTKIVDFRSRRLRGKLTKEEREQYTRIKHIIDLPQKETSEETGAKNEFLRLLRD